MDILSIIFGSGISLVSFSFAVILLNRRRPAAEAKIRVRSSQSLSFKSVFGQLRHSRPKRTKTQARSYNDKKYTRVVLTDTKAYWISDNTFYEADLVGGIVDKDSMKTVDTMGMDKVQLDKMVFIVEALTEGVSDEDWDSGNK